jgi:hypothetical protein
VPSYEAVQRLLKFSLDSLQIPGFGRGGSVLLGYPHLSHPPRFLRECVDGRRNEHRLVVTPAHAIRLNGWGLMIVSLDCLAGSHYVE